MTQKEKVLVYGAAGAQGTSMVRRLLDDGFAVRGLSRSGGRMFDPRAELVAADLDDAEALAAATAGVQKVAFLLPLAFDRAQAVRWTENAVRAAERAGVELFVFDTSAPVPDEEPGVAAVDLKVRAERMVRGAGVPSIIVRPTIYLGNLLAPWAAPFIVEEHVLAYPLPEEARVAWTSWEDAAAAVAAALRRPDLAGRTFHLGGPETLDGPSLARAVGSGLGAELRYASIPLPGFEAGLSQALGAEVGREIAALYRWFAGEGRSELASRGTPAAEALGLTLTNAEEWSRRQEWTAYAS